MEGAAVLCWSWGSLRRFALLAPCAMQWMPPPVLEIFAHVDRRRTSSKPLALSWPISVWLDVGAITLSLPSDMNSCSRGPIVSWNGTSMDSRGPCPSTNRRCRGSVQARCRTAGELFGDRHHPSGRYGHSISSMKADTRFPAFPCRTRALHLAGALLPACGAPPPQPISTTPVLDDR